MSVFISATATWTPQTVSLADAIADGLVPPTHQGLGFDSIAVADALTGPQMAITAARQAIARAGADPAGIGLVLHASHWFQGLDLWPAAAYVANNAVGAHPSSYDIQQQSIGGLGSLRLATAWLTAGFAETALLTTGDNYAAPAIDRWGSLQDLIFGDGGTAMVLSANGGFAEVLATAAGADNGLEIATRGTTPFGFAPGQHAPVPMAQRFMQFAGLPEAPAAWGRYEAALTAVHDQALRAANLDIKDVTRAVLPFLHRGGDQRENYDVLGYRAEQTVWDYGRGVGHLGAGDHCAGLNHLVETGSLVAGDIVVLVGAGLGFNFHAAVLQIVGEPPA
ncbi:ketoacyl-ACP synthase III family protein [Actinokineospora sp. NBRC 105648]|uniref:ketoacyl-ACP synthase III family protein n=1 Tax=Actinokineospora sp. NBRC 105648 TaxID=3032206 RepID=UPI0024A58ABC|nr:ketoacyl-ACP synthase III family protein [Actinokineospora sp. NBRC 105648]GLZ42590.1 hypothetical protein Acsp05_62140 [Actinokineospora sp. NBRC 105648]